MAFFQRNFKSVSLIINKHAKSAIFASQFTPVLANKIAPQQCCCLERPITSLAAGFPLATTAPRHYNVVSTRKCHSKSEGDQQFIEFLSTEIEAEKRDIPKDASTISDFKIEPKGSNVKLTKKYRDETVTVEFSVNHSVTQPEMEDLEEGGEPSADGTEMIAQPNFTVSLQKDGFDSKLCIRCSFLDSAEKSDMPEDDTDAYAIDEVAMVKKEWGDNTFSVTADILDPTMYDMLMLMLDERGVNHAAFSDQLIEFSTDYERSIYISMLESMQKYLQK